MTPVPVVLQILGLTNQMENNAPSSQLGQFRIMQNISDAARKAWHILNEQENAPIQVRTAYVHFPMQQRMPHKSWAQKLIWLT